MEEAISNSSSPLENEKIKHSIEQQQNKDKIDLPVKLTEQQKKQEEKLAFGMNATPIKSSSNNNNNGNNNNSSSNAGSYNQGK